MLLRPRQAEFVARSQRALDAEKNTLGVAPTGAGKTVMLSAIVPPDRYERIVILQHRDELVGQNRRTYVALNRKAITGVVDASDKQFHRPVLFAMTQTLTKDKNLARLGNVDALAIDEAHHAVAPSNMKIVDAIREKNPNVHILGVTATPARGDGKGLRGVFSNVADQIQIGELIRAGHLVKPRTFVVDLGVRDDLRAVKRTAMDFDMDAVARIMDKRPLNDDVVKHWKEKAGDRLTVGFCSTVAHAQHTSEAFADAGVKTGVVYDGMSPEDRRDTLKRFERGDIQVLLNVAILTEGWDCLDAETEILTPHGWRGPGQVVAGNAVYGYDQTTGAIEECPILDVGQRPVRPGEKMLEIDSQHANIRVTEGHRMLVEKNRRGGFKFVTAAELAAFKSEYAIPLAGCASFPGANLSDDELRLIAWYMTDGYITKTGRLEIYQAEHKHADHIERLLRRLGLEFCSRIKRRSGGYPNAQPMRLFGVGKKQITHLSSYLTKSISPDLRKMDARQFSVFWKELLLGDGSRQANKSGWLWTCRKDVADDLCEMAVTRGMSASMRDHPGKASPVWRVSIRHNDKLNSFPGDVRSARMALAKAKPHEWVWCVTNRMGTIITRRRGKVAIVGNCPPVACVILLRPSSHKSTMIQMIGRGLRTVDAEKFPGVVKSDCVVLDFGTSTLQHGSLEQDTVLDGKEKRPGEAPTKLCPECQSTVPLSVSECAVCGHDFPGNVRDGDGAGDDDGMGDFSMLEVDLLEASPFRWEDIWGDGGICVACAFKSWGIALWAFGGWHAIGGAEEEGIKLLGTFGPEGRTLAIATADDWLNTHGNKTDAGKSKQWLALPPSDKQMALLGLTKQKVFAKRITRYAAACMLTWKFNSKGIKSRIMEAQSVMSRVTS